MHNFPYTNFHELNLDWIVETIRKYGNTIDAIPETIRQILGEYIHDGKIDVSSVVGGFVNPENFEGVDDVDRIEKAVSFCNEYGMTLKFSGNKEYRITRVINTPVRCNIDGNGCTFKMEPVDSEQYAFNVVPDAYFNKVYPALNGTFDSELYNKTAHIVSSIDLGERRGFGYHKYAERTVIIDSSGKLVYDPLGFELSESFTAENVQNINQKPVKISGFNVVYNGGAGIMGLCNVTRNNTKIENITVSGYIIPSISGFYAGSVIAISKCNNSCVTNVSGHSPVVADTHGYIINVAGGNQITIDGVSIYKNGTSWAVMGGNYMSNCTFNNCQIERCDCHYMAFGTFNVLNCRADLIKLPEGGFGSINIKNCVLSCQAYSPVIRRDELNILYSGTINIIDCVRTNGENRTIISYVVPADFEEVEGGFIHGVPTINIKNVVYYGNCRQLAIAGLPNQNMNIIGVEIVKTSASPLVRVGANGSVYLKNVNVSGETYQVVTADVNANITIDNCNLSGCNKAANGNTFSALYSTIANFTGQFNTVRVIGCVIPETAARTLNGTTEVVANNISNGSGW